MSYVAVALAPVACVLLLLARVTSKPAIIQPIDESVASVEGSARPSAAKDATNGEDESNERLQSASDYEEDEQTPAASINPAPTAINSGFISSDLIEVTVATLPAVAHSDVTDTSASAIGYSGDEDAASDCSSQYDEDVWAWEQDAMCYSDDGRHKSTFDLGTMDDTEALMVSDGLEYQLTIEEAVQSVSGATSRERTLAADVAVPITTTQDRLVRAIESSFVWTERESQPPTASTVEGIVQGSHTPDALMVNGHSEDEVTDADLMHPSEPDEEEQPTGAQVDETEYAIPSAINSSKCERVARAVLSGFVNASRSSTLESAEQNVLAAHVVEVRSRLIDCENSARILVQHETNVARAQVIREELAIANATRFR